MSLRMVRLISGGWRGLLAALPIFVSWESAAAPEHGSGGEMVSGWQRAFETTRGKVTDERIGHAWSPDG